MKVYIIGKGPVEVIAYHSTGDWGHLLFRDGDDFFVHHVKPGVGWGLVESETVGQEPMDLLLARELFDDVVNGDMVYAPTPSVEGTHA